MSDEARRLSINADDYHADPCDRPSLSASIIQVLCTQSPRHAWVAHPKLNPNYRPEEATHFDIGKIVHALMLQGEWVGEVIEFDDWRKDAAKEARDKARAAGKVPILRKHWTDVQAIIEAANIQISAMGNVFKAPGKAEETITWTEPNGVRCRARLDWLADSLRYIDDLKTTAVTANPEIVSRTMFNHGLDIQAAFYRRAVQMLNPRMDPQFRFVFIETYQPYAMSVVAPGPDVLFLAEKKIQWAIEKWGECLESGVWPGYPTEVCYAQLPAWEENRWLEKETREASV